MPSRMKTPILVLLLCALLLSACGGGEDATTSTTSAKAQRSALSGYDYEIKGRVVRVSVDSVGEATRVCRAVQEDRPASLPEEVEAVGWNPARFDNSVPCLLP
jgi:predicted small secreted protein